MTRAAFVGLGVMGAPMAGHLNRCLIEGGNPPLTVCNRTAAKAAQWVAAHGGAAANTPREAAAGADFVFACVADDAALRAVTLGDDGAFAGMRAGALFIDHTTASAVAARALCAVGAERGVGFVDAPVSGGQIGAEEGRLSAMCGGDAAHCRRARPLIRSFARSCVRIGESGSGQLAKMVNQLCIAGLLQGLAEGLNFGRCAGLEMERVIAAMAGGAAGSWQMEKRAATMLRGAFDFGFAVDWMRKDLRLCLDEAQRNGAPLPVAGQIEQFYARLQKRGGGRWDASALIELLTRD